MIEPVYSQQGMEQEYAAQVISGRRRVDGATRGAIYGVVRHEQQSPAAWVGDLTWDLHGITVVLDPNMCDERKIVWIPYSNIDWIEIEAGS